jgi:hypothetical protein
MKYIIKLSLTIFILQLIACKKNNDFPELEANFSDEYISQHRGNYFIQIPEVYELANIIMAIKYQNSNYDFFIQKNTQYFEKVINSFNSYKSSELFIEFSYTETDFTSNYSFRESSYKYIFENKVIVPTNIYLKQYWINVFEKHLDEIQEFSDISNFQNFYINNLDYYNSQISLYDSLVPIRDIWDWLENQFSKKYDCYKIIFSPLSFGSNSAQWYRTPNYNESLMFVSGFQKEIDTFDTISVLLKTRLLFTEIDHNYVNPASDKYIDEITSSMSNLTVWKNENQINELYDNAYSVFNEYMTWAVYDIYIFEKYPIRVFEDIRQITINKMEEGRGFIRFQEFEDYLISLYQNRADNEKLENLYPQILQWFKDNN